MEHQYLLTQVAHVLMANAGLNGITIFLSTNDAWCSVNLHVHVDVTAHIFVIYILSNKWHYRFDINNHYWTEALLTLYYLTTAWKEARIRYIAVTWHIHWWRKSLTYKRSRCSRHGDDTWTVSRVSLTSLLYVCVWRHQFLFVVSDLCNTVGRLLPHLRQIADTQSFKRQLKTYYYGRTLSERPCYILPLFFFIFFYARLSWPNGWTDLHETFTRGRY